MKKVKKNVATININYELHKKLVLFSALYDINLKDMAEEALTEYLEKKGGAKFKKLLSEKETGK